MTSKVHPQYSLVRPCAKCPFRTDIRGYLTRGRIRDMEREIVGEQKDFFCHQTVDYSGDDVEEGQDDGKIVETSKTCAGMMILLEKINRPTQNMRIAERLGGLYDRRRLDMNAPVFASFTDMEAAQENGR